MARLISLVLLSVAHRWYSWAQKARPDSSFPLWYSAAYHYEAMETGVCTGRLERVCHREGPSRPCMDVAGPNREFRKGGFFSQELQIVYFLGKLATESTWLAQ